MASLDWDEVRLLLDEMISPYIVPRLHGMNIDAIHVLHRGRKGQKDHTIWNWAQNEERALVTINQRHFEPLAARTAHHSGLVAIPGDGSRLEQFNYIAAAALFAHEQADSMVGFVDTVVSVDEALRVSARTLCAIQDDDDDNNVIALPTSA